MLLLIDHIIIDPVYKTPSAKSRASNSRHSRYGLVRRSSLLVALGALGTPPTRLDLSITAASRLPFINPHKTTLDCALRPVDAVPLCADLGRRRLFSPWPWCRRDRLSPRVLGVF